MRWLAHDTRSHGLCDLRSGDWNDGLSPRGENSGRESVMVTEQLCFGLLEVAGLADRLGENAVAAECRALHAEFARRINEHAWDGAWYRRILCDDGTFIGSAQNEEGRIFMNAQSWAVLGRVAPPDRAALCMDSVERHIKLDIGYRIVWPPFTKFDPRVGGSTTVFPGMIENGGCYNHAAGFKGVADCLLGRAEEAWETFRKVAPDNPENPVARSHAEPFAFSNLFMADRYRYARSLYAWNTGTGAWFAVLLLEYILGVRRDYEGLRLSPCLTRHVHHARVIRRFRGATYDIRLDNTAGRCFGLRFLQVDGRPVAGNLLPDFREGHHLVEATI
jgi:cellobiose phosphorylase